MTNDTEYNERLDALELAIKATHPGSSPKHIKRIAEEFKDYLKTGMLENEDE